jgi:DNA-binding NarL/FixJ family response regulator
MRMMRIAIIEDHSLTRTGIRSALNEQQDIAVVGTLKQGLQG